MPAPSSPATGCSSTRGGVTMRSSARSTRRPAMWSGKRPIQHRTSCILRRSSTGWDRSRPRRFSDGKLFTFGISGILSGFDLATGQLLWRRDAPAAGPYYGTAMSPVVEGDLLIAHVGGHGPRGPHGVRYSERRGTMELVRRRTVVRVSGRLGARWRTAGRDLHAELSRGDRRGIGRAALAGAVHDPIGTERRHADRRGRHRDLLRPGEGPQRAPGRESRRVDDAHDLGKPERVVLHELAGDRRWRHLRTLGSQQRAIRLRRRCHGRHAVDVRRAPGRQCCGRAGRRPCCCC